MPEPYQPALDRHAAAGSLDAIDASRSAESPPQLLLGLTVLVAGCSLAVTVGGSLVERKRQFTLLRVSGTPRSVLTRVVLLESVLPLVTASVVAAATGLGVAWPW